MRSRLFALGAIALFAAGSYLQSAQEPQDFDWLTDLNRARLQAKKEGKPLLVVFR